MLAYVGFWAFTYDGVLGVYKGGVKLISDAEQRGSRMEQVFMQRFHGLENCTANELKKLQNQVEANVDQVRSTVFDTRSEVEVELEKRVELVLANVGIPSRDRLERLSQEIDFLNQKIDQELLRDVRPPETEAQPVAR